MAFQKRKINPETQARLRKVAAEMRGLLYGPDGYPEWGTQFAAIEQDGMAVGLELARLLMEQSVDEQAQHMPASALHVPGDEVQSAGSKQTHLETDAGTVQWQQPRAYLKEGRKAFFPPEESAGSAGG